MWQRSLASLVRSCSTIDRGQSTKTPVDVGLSYKQLQVAPLDRLTGNPMHTSHRWFQLALATLSLLAAAGVAAHTDPAPMPDEVVRHMQGKLRQGGAPPLPPPPQQPFSHTPPPP